MRGAPGSMARSTSSGGLGGLGLDHLGRAGADRNLARLHRVGNFADEVDVEKAGFQGRTLDLDVIGELEAALEGTRRDALLEHLAGLLRLAGLLLATDGERAFLRLDRQVGLGKARHRDRDPIGILAGPLDVVGRIAGSFHAGRAIEQRKQPVEAHGRTIEGSKIECTHSMTSFERHAAVHLLGRTPWFAQPEWPARKQNMGRRFAPRKGFGRPIWRGLDRASRLLYSAARRRTLSPMTLVSIPANPVPEGAVTGTLTTPDGRALRFVRFAPPAGRKGTLCVFQGRAEFIEKYYEVVHDARTRGFAVAMIDWRGQGLSERALSDPRKGHVGGFSEFDLDIETFMKEVVLPDCPPPVFALGHSMGGAILLRGAHRGRRWFDRIVLSAPMIELAGQSSSRLAKMSARTLRLLGFSRAYIPGGGATAVPSLPYVGNLLSSAAVR